MILEKPTFLWQSPETFTDICNPTNFLDIPWSYHHDVYILSPTFVNLTMRGVTGSVFKLSVHQRGHCLQVRNYYKSLLPKNWGWCIFMEISFISVRSEVTWPSNFCKDSGVLHLFLFLFNRYQNTFWSKLRHFSTLSSISASKTSLACLNCFRKSFLASLYWMYLELSYWVEHPNSFHWYKDRRFCCLHACSLSYQNVYMQE